MIIFVYLPRKSNGILHTKTEYCKSYNLAYKKGATFIVALFVLLYAKKGITK